MQLVRLKLRNFLIYGKVDLDLSEVKLASIIGQFKVDRRRSNGAGKTALLEAIRYALYDQTRSKTKLGVVKTGAKDCTVELEFIINHRKMRVIRGRSSDGTSTAKVWIDGKEAGDKIKVVNDLIQKSIGVDADLFDHIYFFKQGDQFGFAEANPSDRKAALAKVFRMDNIIRCGELATSNKRTAEEALQRAKATAEALGSRNNSVPPYQHLVDEEMRLSADLATAMQFEQQYAAVVQDNILSLAELQKNKQEFEESIQNDILSVKESQQQVDNVNQSMRNLQISIQGAENLINREQEYINSLKSQVEKGKLKDQAELNKLKSVRIDLESQIVKLGNDIAVIDSQIKSLKTDNLSSLVGKGCPVCKQNVGIDHVESIKTHVNNEIARLQTSRKLIDSNLQAKKLKLKSTNDEILNEDSALQAATTIEQRKASLDAHKTSMFRDKRQYEQFVESRNHIFAQQALTIARVNPPQIEHFRNSIKKHTDKATKLFGDITSSRSSQLTNDVRNAIKLHADCLNSIKLRKEIDQMIVESEVNLKRCRDDFAVYSYLVEAFGKNGIQSLLIENAIGVIETFANDILKQMQTRFVVSLKTQKETKAGDMKESLDIIVYDNGSEKPFESYSGGERTLINIALRLSLSRIIASLHGVQMNCLFLDEVLAPLDEVNREEAIKIIAFLSKSFSQVFVVSHTDEIKNIIDSSIVIIRSDDDSQIIITSKAS